MLINRILDILGKNRFSLQDEKKLQVEIESSLRFNSIPYEREHRLDDKNIPDFFVDGIAIEVKIKGGRKEIFKQCERYAKFNEVKEIILLTNRAIGFPKELNGKPCYVLTLGKAWL